MAQLRYPANSHDVGTTLSSLGLTATEGCEFTVMEFAPGRNYWTQTAGASGGEGTPNGAKGMNIPGGGAGTDTEIMFLSDFTEAERLAANTGPWGAKVCVTSTQQTVHAFSESGKGRIEQSNGSGASSSNNIDPSLAQGVVINRASTNGIVHYFWDAAVGGLIDGYAAASLGIILSYTQAGALSIRAPDWDNATPQSGMYSYIAFGTNGDAVPLPQPPQFVAVPIPVLSDLQTTSVTINWT